MSESEEEKEEEVYTLQYFYVLFTIWRVIMLQNEKAGEEREGR